jgi:hypothetical protein
MVLPSQTPPAASCTIEADLMVKYRTPTFNAIKKHYELYFLGPGSRSLVEQGDTMMDSAYRDLLRPSPSRLAKDIKNKYFKER